jgi:hypothetical protein
MADKNPINPAVWWSVGWSAHLVVSDTVVLRGGP